MTGNALHPEHWKGPRHADSGRADPGPDHKGRDVTSQPRAAPPTHVGGHSPPLGAVVGTDTAHRGPVTRHVCGVAEGNATLAGPPPVCADT